MNNQQQKKQQQLSNTHTEFLHKQPVISQKNKNKSQQSSARDLRERPMQAPLFTNTSSNTQRFPSEQGREQAKFGEPTESKTASHP